jgi:hypothetical protein
MEEWFIIQSFYHGLIHSTREHIDADVGGSFFALSIKEARALIKKMASSQSWIDEHTQTCTRTVHQLEEVDMLTAKIDLLMKKLEDSSLDCLKMVDARITCEEWRNGSYGCQLSDGPSGHQLCWELQQLFSSESRLQFRME